jgi:hypothetical protein
MDRWTDIQIEGRMQALGGGDGLGTPRPRLETMGAGAGAGERVVAGEAAQGRAAAPHGRRHPGSARASAAAAAGEGRAWGSADLSRRLRWCGDGTGGD